LAGNILRSEGSTGRFTKIFFPDGRTGYVLSVKVSNYSEWLATRQPDAGHILATAHEMMGRPYLWGGASGKGMDCSGYTKTVFYLNGVQLPRDANQQAEVGEEVETDSTLKNLLPGDLLFFGRKATPEQKEKITHVAIYLGNGKIIHAANKVEIASLRRGEPDFVEHRLSSFVRSKRMLSTVGKNGVLSFLRHCIKLSCQCGISSPNVALIFSLFNTLNGGRGAGSGKSFVSIGFTFTLIPEK
jgi:hypothetical protein